MFRRLELIAKIPMESLLSEDFRPLGDTHPEPAW
jgi:hypothetical protein